jgi:hypothetical protein
MQNLSRGTPAAKMRRDLAVARLDSYFELSQCRSMIFQIPIFCAQCNTVYPSGIALGPNATIGIQNSIFGCPRGHDSPIPDGTFSVRDGLVQIHTASGSEPVLEKIRRLASDAVKGKSDANDAIKAIEALAPSLAPILKVAGNRIRS